MDKESKREEKEEPTLLNEKTPEVLSTGNKIGYIVEMFNDIPPEALKDTKATIEVVRENISRALAAFSRISSIVNEYGESIWNALSAISSAVTSTIANLKIPELTEEKKKEIENNYRQWGELGWTIIPDSPLGLFAMSPTNRDNANKKAEQYCKKANIKTLFEEMRKKRIKKADLEEAIFCFENRCYKACSVILFGLIDSKLIRMMPKSKNEKIYRPVGAKAAREIEENHQENQALYELLNYVNLFACLKTVFAHANDFRREPSVINRNFVDHGMTNRNVRKRDCIQLFLLLNNFVDTFEKNNKLDFG